MPLSRRRSQQQVSPIQVPDDFDEQDHGTQKANGWLHSRSLLRYCARRRAARLSDPLLNASSHNSDFCRGES
jgi:hypothetical protein